MTNTHNFAKRELDILVKSNTDPENRPLIEPFIPEILAICEKFGISGQSGGSAPYTASALSKAIEKLCLQKPIYSITGIDDEWVEVADKLFQNKRCSSLFKMGDDTPYYLDAIVWKTQKGFGYSGNAILPNGMTINNRQYIKGFPFKPKTFEIDVIEKEVEKDDWEFYVKDEKQLDEVFEYYDRYEMNKKVIG